MKMQGRHTVLVVEDDFDLRDAVCDILEDLGYAALSASDGEEALAALRSGRPIHLILLDLMMPGMNGYEFRELQLRDPALADIPVVVFTAGTESTSTALGPVTYLRKPVELDELVRTVGRFF